MIHNTPIKTQGVYTMTDRAEFWFDVAGTVIGIIAISSLQLLWFI